MASLKTVQNLQDERNDRLVMLNKLIKTAVNDTERVEYYSKHARILFDMNKWNDALIDIGFLEKNQAMSDDLLIIKLKSTLYHEISKVRKSMQETLGLKLFENSEHVDLYINTSEDNINEIINKKHTRKNQSMAKRK